MPAASRGRSRGCSDGRETELAGAVYDEGVVPPGISRWAITGCTILAVIMQALDTTIANVALPYMQGTVSASADQISWVLTSYIVASAIMTPPSGYLTGRFGRKRILLISVAGFVVTSMLCGAAQTLDQLVVFRLLQGGFGAMLVPISMAVSLDIFSLKERGTAMGIFGVAVMVGPVLGPVVGGWLTDHLNWRWIFYINLPLGALAFVGISYFMYETKSSRPVKLDWLGFGPLQRLHRRAADVPRSRQPARLVFVARDHHLRSDCGVGALYLPGPHLHDQEPVHRTKTVPRSELRDRHLVRLHRRHQLSRVDGADDAIPADHDGLSRSSRPAS